MNSLHRCSPRVFVVVFVITSFNSSKLVRSNRESNIHITHINIISYESLSSITPPEPRFDMRGSNLLSSYDLTQKKNMQKIINQ